ncbi:hypothetical protein [uncultured Clostridium sp.]|uniref:hypothetical protein n=1 Tax=uncultured Clostridium sp. TaxID=59620 RepID=UPI0028EA614A|nr:hypothetical protein [uncultured Clostridium sp.]
MDIKGISIVNTKGTFIDFINKNSSFKNLNGSSQSKVNALNKENNDLQISQKAFLKYDVTQKLREAFENGKKNGEFFENIVEEYKKIAENIGEEEKALLEECFDEVLNWGVNTIADEFDSFFNYSSRMLDGYGMTNDGKTFNKEEFKKHFMSALEKSLKGEATNETGDSLEKMSLDDIKNITAFLNNMNKLPFTNNIKDAENNINNFMKSNRELLDKMNISDEAKETLKETMKNNAKAYAKVTSYKNQMNDYDKEIEKLFNLLSGLNSRYEGLEKILEKYKKENNMKMITFHLRSQGELQKEMDGIREKIEGVKKDREKLQKKPDTIESSDGYKELSKYIS